MRLLSTSPFLRLIVALGLLACTRAQEASPEAGRAPGGRADPTTSATSSVAAGSRITRVRAHGSGCPNDASYHVRIAPDGQSVTVELRAYDVSVGPGKAMAVQDCTFSIHAEGGPSEAYGIGALESVTRASVDGPEVRGEETLKVFIQGSPTTNESRSREFLPSAAGTDASSTYSAAYTFPADVAVWSPCGGGRDLAVQSRLVFRNNPDKTGQGRASPSTLKLTLATRSCAG